MREGQTITPEEYPLWREIVKQFVAQDFQEGQIIPHEWFESASGYTRNEHQDKYYDEVGRVKIGLAQLHGIVLISCPGEGYRYLPLDEVPHTLGQRTDDAVRRRVNQDTLLLMGALQRVNDREQVRVYTDRLLRNGQIALTVNARKTKATIKELSLLIECEEGVK